VQIAYRDGVLHLNPMPSVNSLFNSPFFVRARKAGTQLYIPVEVDPGVPNYYALYTLSSDAYFESKSVPKTGKRYWNDLRAGSTGWACSEEHLGLLSDMRLYAAGTEWIGDVGVCAMPGLVQTSGFQVGGILGHSFLSAHTLVLDYKYGLVGLLPPGARVRSIPNPN
jgi:hypothetical protein